MCQSVQSLYTGHTESKLTEYRCISAHRLQLTLVLRWLRRVKFRVKATACNCQSKSHPSPIMISPVHESSPVQSLDSRCYTYPLLWTRTALGLSAFQQRLNSDQNSSAVRIEQDYIAMATLPPQLPPPSYDTLEGPGQYHTGAAVQGKFLFRL